MRQHAPDKRSGGMINTYQRKTVSNIRNHPPLGASPAVALSEKAETGQKHTCPKHRPKTARNHTANSHSPSSGTYLSASGSRDTSSIEQGKEAAWQ